MSFPALSALNLAIRSAIAVAQGGCHGPTDYEAYWSMNDAQVSGNTLLDQSGNSHTATMVNTPTTGETGQVNEAVLFNGTNEYAVIPNVTAIRPVNISVCAWVKSSVDGGVVFQSYSQDTNYAGCYLHMSSGSTLFVIGSNTGTTQSTDFDITSGAGILDDVYHHICGTYDGSDMRLYIDGILAKTKSYAGGLA